MFFSNNVLILNTILIMLAKISTLKFILSLVPISLLVSATDGALHYLGCKLFTGGFEMQSSFCSKSYTDFKLTMDICSGYCQIFSYPFFAIYGGYITFCNKNSFMLHFINLHNP